MNVNFDYRTAEEIRRASARKASRHTGEAPSSEQLERLLERARLATSDTVRMNARSHGTRHQRLALLAASILLSAIGVAAYREMLLNRDKPSSSKLWAASSNSGAAVPTKSNEDLPTHPNETLQSNSTKGRQNGALGSFQADAENRMVRIHNDRIHLKPDTRVSLLLETATETRLAVERGNAAFSVSKRKEGEAFVVQAGPVNVRVIGTVFSVERTSDGAVEVAVAEGIVSVSDRDRQWSVRSGESIQITGDLLTDGPLAAPESEAASLLSTFEEAEATSKEPGLPEPNELPATNRIRNRDVMISEWKKRLADKDFEAVGEELRRHLKLSPNDGAVWSLLADCLRMEKRWREAVVAYSRAVSVGDAFQRVRARFLMGVVYQDEIHDDEAAASAFASCLTEGDAEHELTADAMVRLARSKIRIGRTADAKQLLSQVINKFKDSPAALRARNLLDAMSKKSEPAM